MTFRERSPQFRRRFSVVLGLSATGDDFDTPAGASAGAVVGLFAIPIIYSSVRRMSPSGGLAGLVAVGVLAVEVLCERVAVSSWFGAPVRYRYVGPVE